MNDAQVERFRAALADRYAVERELGSGGMAVVYLARDLRHERHVALKVLRPELGASLGAERFLQEIRLAARLQHRHILAVYDSGDAGGHLYYVMPYVEGESLGRRLEREGPLPLAVAVGIAREVAEALAYAHERGIIHRDIKPDNILLHEGHVLVADFGIARAVDAAGLKLTETGLAVGTPLYMSPEQAAGDPHTDARTDTYALGCVLYETLAGAPPFSGAWERLSAADVPALGLRRPDVPPAVEAAITRALAKEPGGRFTSAAAFAEALESATGLRAGAAGHRRGRVAAAVAAAVLTALAVWRFAVAAARSEPTPVAAHSIAVLPMRNSGDTADAYYAEGIGEQIGSALVRVPGVSVHSWAAVLEAVRESRNPAVLGPALHVDYILDGSLQRAGRRTRVSVQLVRVSDGAVVWSQPYDGDGADIFAIQDSVSRAVAAELALRLSPEAQRALAHRTTRNPEAYNAYLLGRHFQWQLTVPGLDQAITYYRQAIALDSGYAEAWQGLVEASALRDERGQGREGPPVTALIDRVLELDSTNGAAHAYRAERLYLAFEFAAAAREFALAIRYAPGVAENLILYAQFLNVVGRHAEALEVTARAAALNPTSSFVIANHAIRFNYVSRYDSAAAVARRAVALEPGNWVAHVALGYALVGRGDPGGAVEEMERAQQLLGGAPALNVFVGWAYGRAGRRDDAREVLAAIEADSAAEPSRRVDLVVVRLGLGDTTDALDYLEEEIRGRKDAGGLFYFRDPLVSASLRGVPRFEALLRRAELP